MSANHISQFSPKYENDTMPSYQAQLGFSLSPPPTVEKSCVINELFGGIETLFVIVVQIRLPEAPRIVHI